MIITFPNPLTTLKSLITGILVLTMILTFWPSSKQITRRTSEEDFLQTPVSIPPFVPGEGIEQPQYDHPKEHEEEIVDRKPKIPILWVTSISLNDGSSGFANEVISFITPLTKVVRVGWLNLDHDDQYDEIKNEHKFWGQKIINVLDEQNAWDTLQIQHAAKEAEYLKNISPKIIVFQSWPIFIPKYLETIADYVKPGDYKVIRSMFETDSLPDQWVQLINTDMDEVWVPSQFARSVYLKEGVKKDVRIVGEGFNPRVFNSKRPKTKVETCCKPGDHVFLAIGKNEVRKGWSILIESYAKSFYSARARVPVCLVISSSGATVAEDLYNPLALQLGPKLPSTPTVCKIDKLPLREYSNLFKADVFVLSTHGEGWGRPIMEAMASGLPVIVPYWGGVTAYVTPHNAIPIRVNVLETAYRENQHILGGSEFLGKHQWAHINVTELGRAMRWTFDNRQQARQIGKLAEEYMIDNWTRDKVSYTIRKHVLRIEDDILKN